MSGVYGQYFTMKEGIDAAIQEDIKSTQFIKSVKQKEEFKTTRVKKVTSIGANATLVCDVTLGEYCFVGDGAIITKNVKPFALMIGVPDRQKI